MTILKQLSALAAGSTTANYTFESIQTMMEANDKKKLTMSRVHTVMLDPSDMDTKDKVFGIRNEDPIVEFMLEALGVPRDGLAIKIRNGFMQYDAATKMLFIAKFKSDLPGEKK